MNKLNKNYLVIKNVNQDKNLKQYLEQICLDEKVCILYEEFNKFDNINILLNRTKPYIAIGRLQGELEAAIIEKDIKIFLQVLKIPFTEYA